MCFLATDSQVRVHISNKNRQIGTLLLLRCGEVTTQHSVCVHAACVIVINRDCWALAEVSALLSAIHTLGHMLRIFAV